MLKQLTEHRPVFTRGLIILATVLGILLLGAAAFAFSSTVRIGVVKTTLNVVGATIPVDENGFTNILLLGVGDEWHDAPDLTDTMIIASIDPGSTKSIVMVSLPRDLLIDTDTRSVSGRINAIYANEKRRQTIREKKTPEEADQLALRTVADEVGRKTGVTIHGVIKADFTAFTEVVDALGGIDIDVPEKVTDYTYPIAEGQVGLFQVEAGFQHFDGETALKYARSRHSSTDFDRSARQQLLLKALAAEARELSMVSQANLALDVWRRLEGHVVTTFDRSQILGLVQIGTELSINRMITSQLNYNVGGDGIEAGPGGFVYPAPPELYEGASVLLPLPLPGKESNWGQIETYVQFLLRFRSLYLTKADIAVQSAGVPQAQAWRLRNELLRYGWMPLPLEKQLGTGSTTYSSVYYRDNAFESAAEWMGHLLDLPVARATDEQTGSGDIILSLGSDFRYRPFQTLSGGVLRP